MSDDDYEIVPVPLDRATRERLRSFAAATGQSPVEAARALMTELLFDDELWNAAAEESHLLH